MRNSLLVFALVLGLTAGLFGATQAASQNTIAPTLTISATIQKAVSLTLATGATASISHCNVTATGASPDFTMNFGNVDALGINGGNCNKFNPVTPGTSNAVYWTDYALKPVYTTHATTTGSTIKAYVSTNFAGSNLSIVRSATANSATTPTGAADFAAMATTATGDTVASATDIVNGGTLTRFIGVSVAPDNGTTGLVAAGTTATATVTFTMTIN